MAKKKKKIDSSDEPTHAPPVTVCVPNVAVSESKPDPKTMPNKKNPEHVEWNSPPKSQPLKTNKHANTAADEITESEKITKETFSGLTKSQRKNLKKKLSKRDNRRASDASAASAVQKVEKDEKKKKTIKKQKAPELPRDPLHEERECVLGHLREEFESLSRYLTEEIAKQQNANENPQNQSAYKQLLDSLVRQIDDAGTRQMKRVKRPENKRLQASELLQQIQEIELAKAGISPDMTDNAQRTKHASTHTHTHTHTHTTAEELASVGVVTSSAVEDEDTLRWLREQLVLAVSFEQHKKFQKSLTDLKSRCTTLLDEIHKAQTDASKSRQKEKIAQRLKVLKQYKPNSNVTHDASDILTQTFELPQEIIHHLFSNMNFAKRLEKIYTVTIDRPRNDKNKQRCIVVSGLEEDLKVFSNYAANVKIVRLNTAVDPRTIAAVIGKQGAGIKNMEDTFDCLLHVESNNEIVAVGIQENCDKALKHIETIKFEPTETYGHADIVCDADVGKFLENNIWSEVQKITNSTNSIINIQKPSYTCIHVRGPQDKLDSAVAKVNSLKQPIIVRTLKAPEENIRKLFSGNREISPSVRSYFDVLKECRKVRMEEKASSGQVKLIGLKGDIDSICEKLVDLLEKAGFVYHKVPLNPEHSHIFRDDALARVGFECKCDLRIMRSKEREGQTILIHGSETAKNEAVQMIHKIIDEEGRTKTVNVESETFALLVLNRMHKIMEIQDLTGCYVKIDRKKRNEVVVIGTNKAVDEAVIMITDLDSALKQQRAEEVTEELTIDKGQTGIIIGHKGQTVSYLLDKSKASRIDVDKNVPGKVVIKGKPECVEKAKKLIDEVLNRNKEGENKKDEEIKSPSLKKSGAKGFYSKHSPNKKTSQNMQQQTQQPTHSTTHQVNTEDISVFPSITDAAKMKPHRHKYRQQTKNKKHDEKSLPVATATSPTPVCDSKEEVCEHIDIKVENPQVCTDEVASHGSRLPLNVTAYTQEEDVNVKALNFKSDKSEDGSDRSNISSDK